MIGGASGYLSAFKKVTLNHIVCDVITDESLPLQYPVSGKIDVIKVMTLRHISFEMVKPPIHQL